MWSGLMRGVRSLGGGRRVGYECDESRKPSPKSEGIFETETGIKAQEAASIRASSAALRSWAFCRNASAMACA